MPAESRPVSTSLPPIHRMNPTPPNTASITSAISSAFSAIRAIPVSIGRLDALAERAPGVLLVRIRLHGADLVQRLVDVDADVGDAVLSRARRAPDAPAEDQPGSTHQRRNDHARSWSSFRFVQASIASAPTSSSELRTASEKP